MKKIDKFGLKYQRNMVQPLSLRTWGALSKNNNVKNIFARGGFFSVQWEGGSNARHFQKLCIT